MKTRRIVIFQVYSPRGIVENHILYLIDSFREISDRIIAVCNMPIEIRQKQILEQHCDEAYYRDDFGFDAGSFKDYFLNFAKEDWRKWDEVVTANSSFFGPLYPWNTIFGKMDDIDCDIWGLTKHSGDIANNIPEHMQPYIAIYRSAVIHSSDFMDFWKQVILSNNYFETITNYEFFLTKFFTERRYEIATYMEQFYVGKELIKSGKNAILTDVDLLIRKCQFPVIKCRTLDLTNYSETKKFIQVIKNCTKYKLSLIFDYDDCNKYPRNKVLEFVSNRNRIFIYGNGKIGNNIKLFLSDNGYSVDAMVVSKKKKVDEIAVEELEICKNDCIIIGLDVKYVHEVRGLISANHINCEILWPACDVDLYSVI